MKIQCAKCNRSVETIETIRPSHTNDIRIRVRCHGEVDEMVVLAIDLMNPNYFLLVDAEQLEGVAFKQYLELPAQ